MGQSSSYLSPEAEDPWFRPNRRNRDYDQFGDAYDDSTYKNLCKEWFLESEGKDPPYLTFVRTIKNYWPHLKLLADFMEIGTHPERWNDLKPPGQTEEAGKDEKTKPRSEKRKLRREKMKVCRLDYYDTGEIKNEKFYSTDCGGGSSAAVLLEKDLDLATIDRGVQFRLYVVEDLSNDVIEVLGSKLGINPSFFRAHIVDYAWYNVLDRWRDPPNLDVICRRQNWFQLRFVTARYFQTREAFDAAATEAEAFNILRRPDDDISNNAWWDDKNAVVGLTRSRATFWLKDEHVEGTAAEGTETPAIGENTPPIGVLLLDPTVEGGYPLWRGRRNWSPIPDVNSLSSTWDLSVPEPTKFYDDFLYWAQRPGGAFSSSPPSISNIHHIPVEVLLHLVCSEWRTMSDYIKTRLCQIDLEIFKPTKFATNYHVDNALDKLNMWRRFIPLYREMVSETLEQVFRFPCHTETFFSTEEAIQGQNTHGQDIASLTPRPLCEASPFTNRNNPQLSSTPANPIAATPVPATAQPGSIDAYKTDFILILSYLDEYQKRIDRLTSVVTAAMQIEDSRRGLRDGRNIGRLTWLATFFIPFSLVATWFAMDVDKLHRKTWSVYFASAVPFSIVIILVAWILSHPWFWREIRGFRLTHKRRIR